MWFQELQPQQHVTTIQDDRWLCDSGNDSRVVSISFWIRKSHATRIVVENDYNYYDDMWLQTQCKDDLTTDFSGWQNSQPDLLMQFNFDAHFKLKYTNKTQMKCFLDL